MFVAQALTALVVCNMQAFSVSASIPEAENGPAGRALKATAGVDLVSTASQASALSEAVSGSTATLHTAPSVRQTATVTASSCPVSPKQHAVAAAACYRRQTIEHMAHNLHAAWGCGLHADHVGAAAAH
jgi:hypothetical protein